MRVYEDLYDPVEENSMYGARAFYYQRKENLGLPAIENVLSEQ